MAIVKFTLNHQPVTVQSDLNRRLLDVIRNDFNLKGLKEGCGEGECGACAVLINHEIVNSCLFVLANVEGKEVITIEEFAKTKRFTVIKEAFAKMGAVQCGFCTPGMVIATESLLHKNPHPTEMEIKVALSGNLCRCTGYNMIVEAIQEAAKAGEGLW
ncbi:MAG: (2Fe-2S)-binding protein [Candidatus Izemoplasmatales bacterium]|nr:(2Fe-2S)-binding protein [Candidatus Izemoplasmatales bacterium]MDD3865150.1 (2Fe-2S)-binding protein [Candidatus Izemoplasmatales bacterium]